MIVYLARDIPAFVMYYVYGESRSSLLIVYQLYDRVGLARARLSGVQYGQFHSPVAIFTPFELAGER